MEKKQHSCSSGSSFKYWAATILILSGSLLLGRNLGWVSYELFSIVISWQMLLIVIGIYQMSTRHWFGGLILSLIGLCFMAPMLNLSWLPINMSQLLWPAALIITGVACLGKFSCRSKHRKRREEFGKNEYTSTDGYVRVDNVFGSTHQVVLDEVFKGASIHNRFGGTVLDLRRTNIPEGDTFIDLDCTFGGIELYVPTHWKVDTVCDVFMGGCDDKRAHHPNIDMERKLILRGDISFSGVEIKS